MILNKIENILFTAINLTVVMKNKNLIFHTPLCINYTRKKYFFWLYVIILFFLESWYSVTPEVISRLIAKRCACDLIIDGFCGAGSNSIQFAFTSKKGR